MQLEAPIAVAVVPRSAAARCYAIKTTTDYDHAVNFANYRTVCVMKGNASGNPLLDQRATDDLRIDKMFSTFPSGELAQ